jgi:probable rRNA maturation factor
LNMTISVTDKRFAVNKRAMATLVNCVLKRESSSSSSLDVIYCRDCDIMPLNRRFKRRRGSTDVLAFDLRDPDQRSYLGEVYVNLQMARRQARENRVLYIEEVKRLTVHGILHLLGYRDDTPENRLWMWARQESYLR